MIPGAPISRILSPRARTGSSSRSRHRSCLWSAWPFYVRFAQSLKNKSLNMFTLIGLGVSVAYGYSLVATLAPQIFPESFREHGGPSLSTSRPLR